MIRLLENVRVLECAALLCGPTLTSHLADLGADVIKVEAPPLGDYMRDILGSIGPRQSPAHLQINKNKRSIRLNLRKAEGLEIFWKLLDETDVFVDGFMAGACDRLGIGFEQQRARKPDIIYCQYTGFGATGPYANIPTHGRMMNAAAGSYPVEVRADGLIYPKDDPDGGFGGVQEGGEATGTGAVYGALFVAAAVARRAATGEGCYIDVAASDAVIASSWSGAIYAANAAAVLDRSTMPTGGEDGPKLVDPPPARALEGARYYFYETSDGKFIMFAAMERKWWHRFCEVVERTDLIKETDVVFDFAGGDRELYFTLREVFLTKTQAEWVSIAAANDLPVGPVNVNVAELLEDQQIQQRQILVHGTTPSGGPFVYVGMPGMVDGQPFEVRRMAPSVGEHSKEILGEIGLSEVEIKELESLDII